MKNPVNQGDAGLMLRNGGCAAVLGIVALLLCTGASQSWLSRVPASYRQRMNPYSGQPGAVAAGHRLFLDHCAQCHQRDAMGKGRRPSLRTALVQNATDGELFWLLRNGILGHGMPSWSMLPGPERWQIIAYVKSLGQPARPRGQLPGARNPIDPSAPEPGGSK